MASEMGIKTKPARRREADEPRRRKAPPRTKGEYIDVLRRRRAALVRGQRRGEARAMMLAMSYLRVATVGRTRWALQCILDGEKTQTGPYWFQSRRAMRRILRELEEVVDA